MEEVMDFSRRFERAFVELVGRRLENKAGRKASLPPKFGRTWISVPPLFFGLPYARREKMVDRVTSRLPRRYAIADVLGEDVGYLFAIARESVKEEQETPQK